MKHGRSAGPSRSRDSRPPDRGGGGAGLAALLEHHRVVVCVGSGGVGKTTVAASLALAAACIGRRTIVLTIDPARRLADSLGVGPIGNTPRPVPLDGLAARPGGSLDAMMLDQKGSWDELVERHAPSPQVAARIRENPFYQQLSESFAGSQEYMAVEQLDSLVASGRWDLVVVDTPPTQHAIDFLEAPQRLLRFLDRGVVRWFVSPSGGIGWSALQVMNRTTGFLLRQLESATGLKTLGQVSNFFNEMSGLFDGFEERFQRVMGLLSDARTAFVLIASPDEQVLGQVDFLIGRMNALDMPLKGVVMNRIHDGVLGPEIEAAGDEALRAGLEAALAPLVPGSADLVRRLLENLRAHQARARGDALRIESFRDDLGAAVPLVEVPELDGDVHDLHGLAGLRGYLLATAPPSP